MVVSCLSKSSFKLLLLAPNLLTPSRWRFFRVVGGRQRCFVSFPWSFTVVHARLDRPQVYPSDPVVDCLRGLLLVFAKLSFMFRKSFTVFRRNFIFSNDRERPLVPNCMDGYKNVVWRNRFLNVSRRGRTMGYSFLVQFNINFTQLYSECNGIYKLSWLTLTGSYKTNNNKHKH